MASIRILSKEVNYDGKKFYTYRTFGYEKKEVMTVKFRQGCMTPHEEGVFLLKGVECTGIQERKYTKKDGSTGVQKVVWVGDVEKVVRDVDFEAKIEKEREEKINNVVSTFDMDMGF